MVSKARLDFPEPESPVMQMSFWRGSRTVMSLRLCSLAPWTTSSSAAMWRPFYRANGRSLDTEGRYVRPVAKLVQFCNGHDTWAWVHMCRPMCTHAPAHLRP